MNKSKHYYTFLTQCVQHRLLTSRKIRCKLKLSTISARRTWNVQISCFNRYQVIKEADIVKSGHLWMAQCKQFTCSVTLHPKGNSPSAYRHFLPVVNYLVWPQFPPGSPEYWSVICFTNSQITLVMHVKAHSAALLCITKDWWNIFSSLFN